MLPLFIGGAIKWMIGKVVIMGLISAIGMGIFYYQCSHKRAIKKIHGHYEDGEKAAKRSREAATKATKIREDAPTNTEQTTEEKIDEYIKKMQDV